MVASTELTPNYKHRGKKLYDCILTKAVNSETVRTAKLLNNFGNAPNGNELFKYQTVFIIFQGAVLDLRHYFFKMILHNMTGF